MRSVVRRALNYGSFAVAAALLGSVLGGPVEVIFAEHPPLTIGLAAWVIGRLRRVPFLYAVNDLWPESVEATGMVRSRRVLDNLGMAGRFNVVFAGQLGLAQGLDVVLDAAEEISDLPDVQFVLVGDGTDAERLRLVAGARGLQNVRFLGRQPAERMPEFFGVSDVLL